MEETTLTLSTRFIVGLVMSGFALGGILIASLLNLRTARGPLERRYLYTMTPIMWVLLISFIFLLYLTTYPWRYVVLLAYLFLLPLFVYRISWRRQLIRKLEASNSKTAPDEP